MSEAYTNIHELEVTEQPGLGMVPAYQRQMHPVFPVRKPDPAPPTEVTWWGGKKLSALAAAHNQQLDRIFFAGEETNFAIRQGLWLEYTGFAAAARTIVGQLDIYRSLPVNSPEAVILQDFLLESVQRQGQLLAVANEQYRHRTLG